MPKPLIVLNNLSTLVNDFNSYFNGSNVPFVVLGNTAQHKALANTAAGLADNWNVTIHVPSPTGLYPTLVALSTDGCSLSPFYDSPNLFAVAIAPDRTICYVMSTYDPASITIATMLATTH